MKNYDFRMNLWNDRLTHSFKCVRQTDVLYTNLKFMCAFSGRYQHGTKINIDDHANRPPVTQHGQLLVLYSV